MGNLSVTRKASDSQVADLYLTLERQNRLSRLFPMGSPSIVDFVMDRRRDSIYWTQGGDLLGIAWIFDIRCTGPDQFVAEAAFAVTEDAPYADTLRFCRESVDEALFHKKMECVTMLVPSGNRKACVLLAAAGLKVAGTIPNYSFFEGLRCDGVLFAIDKQSWLAKMETK